MKRASPGSVFLLTDFGTKDEFAGVLRAVVLREAPGCPVVDLTHEIPPFDVRAGALALERVAPHLGPGVVVAVVDPGVGTGRRAVAVAVAKAGGPGFLVGPDNGLLGFAIDALGGAVSAAALPALSPRPGFGATFDGRDVFAPAAARLWVGARPEELGKRVATHSLVRLEPPQLHVEHGRIEAEVLWVDSFGNVQLAARHADAVDARLGIEQLVVASSTTVPSRSVGSFAGGPGDAPEGDAVGLLADSNGHLALVCRRRSAATVLGVKAGDVITLRNREPADPETQLGARS